METASKAETVRLPYLDYLRVMAAAAVIMIHVSAQNWDNVPVMSSDWIIFNLYNSLAQWAVPMFLMLSGALMLDPGKPFQIRTLYRKNILRRHPGASRHRLPWHQYKKTDRMPLSSVKHCKNIP